jgi:hypothetical protein
MFLTSLKKGVNMLSVGLEVVLNSEASTKVSGDCLNGFVLMVTTLWGGLEIEPHKA